MKKQLSFQLRKKIADYYEKNYGNKNKGSVRAAESFPYLREQVLESLKGRFLREELVGLIDRSNGMLFEPTLAVRPEVLQYGVADYCNLEQGDQRQGFKKELLLEKLEKLSPPEAFFLAEWADTFWIQKEKERDLEEYIQRLI